MASLTRLGFCLLLAPFTPLASAGTKRVLLWAAARAPDDPTAETLREIDGNQDGHIDPSEVSAFAQSEGLDTASAMDDFSAIDTNSDGTLDPAELIQVLGTGAEGSSTTLQDLAPTPKPPSLLAENKLPSASGAAHVVSGLASEKPIVKHTNKHEAHIGIQETHPARVLTPPQAKAPQATEAKQATDAKPRPVERMVKHFAQVLRTADIVPMRPETLKPKDTPAVLDTNPRATVQSAAKEVAEQLYIAESAEAKARVLDRRAAEELANATVLAKLTTQEALNAGAAAAHSKANELLASMAKLEDQAERAQVRSAALHSKAKLETDEASELMAVADRALNHPPKQPL